MLYGVKFMTERKVFKKIDASKIKNVDGFIDQLINIIYNKTVLLKTTVTVKLNCIISDLKEKYQGWMMFIILMIKINYL